MYKTVRQGENSLQYTILPQTEEVLCSSGGKGKGRDYSPSSSQRRVSKRLVIYYLAVFLFGLFLVFGVVFVVVIQTGIFPVDLPVQLSKTKHTSWLGQSSRLIAADLAEKSQSRKKDLTPDVKSIAKTSNSTQEFTTIQNIATQTPYYNSTAMPDGNINTTSADITTLAASTVSNASTPSPQSSTAKLEWIMPALKRLQSSTLPPIPSTEKFDVTTVKDSETMSSFFPTHQRESNNDLMLGHDQIGWTDYDDVDDEDYDVTKPATTATANTKKAPLIINKSLPAKSAKSTKQTIVNTTPSVPIVYSTITTVNSSSPAEENDTINKKMFGKYKNKTKFMETKESILDDDDEDYNKEPLADEEDVSVQGTGRDDVKMSQTKSSWLQTGWPFVDFSSYFQWTVSATPKYSVLHTFLFYFFTNSTTCILGDNDNNNNGLFTSTGTVRGRHGIIYKYLGGYGTLYV